MTPSAALRIRTGLGLVLALAPAFPIFQTGRYSTLKGAGITIGATAVAVLLAWWTRPDPELPPRWGRLIVIGIVAGLSTSLIVAYGLGANVPTIVRFSWIPLLRAVAVSAGICLILSTLEGPVPLPPIDAAPGSPPHPQSRSS